MMLSDRKFSQQQSGAALLLMLLVIVTAASAVLVTKLQAGMVRNQRIADTHHSLALARQALLDYATSYADFFPGEALRLPCPDIDTTGPWLEGEAHSTACGAPGVTVIGKFPWRTLGSMPYRDSSSTCLWYVVSGSYKDAAAATLPMINPDTNGQLQVYSVDSGLIISGSAPQERPVAVLFAPMEPLSGQSRSGVAVAGQSCSNNYNASDFLDADGTLGISNALLTGNPYALEAVAITTDQSDSHNDRVITIDRQELANIAYERHDFGNNMSALTEGIAACVAEYGRSNSAGATDKRLPWPAPLAMTDYALDSFYTDTNSGVFSGRLPDAVDDSATITGNSMSQLLGDCDPLLVAEWDSTHFALWQTWKDHFFYVVADAFQPSAVIPASCGDCLSVNGAGQYAAIVLFSGPRLDALGQVRDAPPLDADTRDVVSNYLEGSNAINHPYSGGVADYQSLPASDSFNDIAYCIDTSLSVAVC